MSDDKLQAMPARAALLAPPQPELLGVRNVGQSVVKVNQRRPTGTIKRAIPKRASQ